MRKDKRVISVLFVGIIVCLIYLLAEKKQMLTVNEEENIQEDISEEVEIELGNIKTVISPERMSCIIALDENGNVWQWEEGKTKEDAVVIAGVEDVVQIVDTGYSSVYALTSEGDVYAWGLNHGWLIAPEERETSLEFPEPVKKSEDNQIFSIISIEYFGERWKYLIIPNFQGESSAFDWQNEVLTGNSERIFDIRKESGFYLAYLYKMGENDNVALMGADAYTMYVYQNDGTLWYWNSDRITYHDYEEAGASVELRDLDYSGFFEEVDIGSVLDVETDSTGIPEIISISPGKEGALFLLENGQVLVSEYVTAEIKDVEFFGRNNTPPIQTWTGVIHDFTTKKLSLRKLDFENIANISTDKNNKFYLVDGDGNIYCYQMEKSTS